ncbi:MAG TPA: hypothetical protein VJX30_01775 [Terriglobales bacterium]|nr:hypothetical protein [Terriglobales bacterium]
MARNPRVSADEIRARRLAREAREQEQVQEQAQGQIGQPAQPPVQLPEFGPVQEQAPIPQQTQTGDRPAPTLVDFGNSGLSGESGIGGSAWLGSGQETLAEAMPAPAPSPVIPTAVTTDLDSLLASLDASQLARMRSMATQKGLIGPDAQIAVIAPDGSLTVSVKLDADVVSQLENWREPTDVSLADTATRYIREALTNYLYGDWNPVPEPAPVVAAATTATTTTVTTGA